MKQIFSAAAIVIIFSLASCSKSDSGTNTAPGAFTYKVDGTSVTADSVVAILYTLGVPPNNRMIDLYVYKGSSTLGGLTFGNVALEMHFLPKTGAQTVSPAFAGAWLTYSSYTSGNPIPTASYDGTTGSFNMSVCDTTGKKLTGTFNFTGTATIGTGTKTISEGNFSITKIEVQ